MFIATDLYDFVHNRLWNLENLSLQIVENQPVDRLNTGAFNTFVTFSGDVNCPIFPLNLQGNLIFLGDLRQVFISTPEFSCSLTDCLSCNI